MEKKMMRVQESSMGILPSDLLLQVLSRLQPGTLVRFRCVSKQWLDLISDPFFINLHSNESKTKPLYVGVYRNPFSSKCKITITNPVDPSSAEIFSLKFPEDAYTIRYSSGFLLFYGSKKYIHVVNPSTREVLTRKHDLHSGIQERFPDNEFYDVPDRNVLTGFGFVPSTSQHKIIELFGAWNVRSCIIVTLPNKNTPGSWKITPVNINCLKYVRLRRDIYNTFCLNGIIYWEIWFDVKTEDKLQRKILTFDLEAEEFRLLTSPLPITKKLPDEFMADLNGVVCLVDVNSREFDLNIWILKDNKNEIWAKEYSINYPPKMTCGLTVPLVVEQVDGKKRVIFQSSNGNFYRCNLTRRTFKRLGEEKYIGYTLKSIHYGSLLPFSSCGLMMPTTL